MRNASDPDIRAYDTLLFILLFCVRICVRLQSATNESSDGGIYFTRFRRDASEDEAP